MATFQNFGKKEVVTSNFPELIQEVEHFIISQNRGDSPDPIDLNKKDIIELVYSDGTTWIGSAGDIHEINGYTPELRGEQEGIVIPMQLNSNDTSRGMGSVILKSLFKMKPVQQVINTKLHETLDHLESRIKPEEGLFYLDNEFVKTKVKDTLKKEKEPYLLFIHGTASSTSGSFDKLMLNSENNLWKQLCDQYKNRIITLEHKTITKSPLQNVLDLVQFLPDQINLHVISHSRGGIVGDILSCYSHESGKTALREVVGKDRKHDLELIKQLDKAFGSRKVKVEKFIRVACPAAGTTLLGDKLENFLNVLANIIKKAQPQYGKIADVVKQMIVAIISLKNNEDVLPGLEAMVPDSPFQRMLNHPKVKIQNNLAVIAGDGVAALSWKGLGTIVSNLIYWHDNDWIVDTASMNKGLKRVNECYYYFSQHKEVNHFSYFNNTDTREAILFALQNDAKEWSAHFTSYDGTIANSIQRGVITKLLTGEELKPNYESISGNKPVVLLIPGILGSNLYDTSSESPERIYMDEVEIMKGGFVKKLDIKQTHVEALSIIGKKYENFVEHFSEKFDVFVFPYDWRKSIKDSATHLSNCIEKITSLTNQPLLLVAHSMGGLVTRHLAVVNPKLYQKISSRPEFRLLFLGSPLQGAYIVPQILLGQGSIFKMFSRMDLPHGSASLMNTFNNYPGLINLLPIKDSRHDFISDNSKTWKEIKDYADSNFSIPDTTWMANYMQELEEVQGIVYSNDKVFYIAGTDDKTICDFQLNESVFGQKEIKFLSTSKGDGKVTWESGIPETLKKQKRVFYVDTVHGDLANDTNNFRGIMELLVSGSTSSLSGMEPNDRSGNNIIEFYKEEPIFGNDETAMLDAFFGKKIIRKAKVNSQFTVTVKCGDLYYSKYPIMVGHFKYDGIVSAEKAVDRYLKNKLSQKHALGIYPDDIGRNAIFTNNHNKISAIVIGLGEPENLSGSHLERAITSGALNYLLEVNNDINKQNEIGISVVLIGSSFAGLCIDTSIKAIFSGINSANTIMLNKFPNINTITQLEIVELYEDRAIQAMKYILKETNSGRINNIQVAHKQVQKEKGRKKRIVYEFIDEWWNHLTINRNFEGKQLPSNFKKFDFSASSGAAKIDKKELTVDLNVINSLLDDLASNQNWDMELAKIIFELLIPNDFKLSVRNQQNILLMLDNDSAEIPWELLHDAKSYEKPLATQVGIIRQLTVKDSVRNVAYASNNKALIIGDPLTDGFFSQLPNAKKEAEEMEAFFKSKDIDVNGVINQNLFTIYKELFKDHYRIIHLAGHGVYEEDSPYTSGMVIGKDSYLSPNTINQLSALPDLVFINCCHIGQIDANDNNASMKKHKLAATLGTQLIQMGVKCVIAAAWAIDDAAARHFTKVFYQEMFAGKAFGDAVKMARESTYNEYSHKNTWAAYQCYGDQFYTLAIGNPPTYEYEFMDEEEVKVELQNLSNRLDTDKDDLKDVQKKVTSIVEGIRNCHIKETNDLRYLVADIYVKIRDYQNAIEYLHQIASSSKSNYPLDTLEKLYMIRYKKYVSDCSTGMESSIQIQKDVISPLKKLNAIKLTSERLSLLGSAYKSMANFETKKELIVKNLTLSSEHYADALIEARKEGVNSIYPLSNKIVIDHMLIQQLPDKKVKEEALLKTLHQEMKECEKVLSKDNFWDLMAEPNFLLVKMLLTQDGKILDELKNTIEKVWDHGGTAHQKMSELEHVDFLIKMYDQFMPSKSNDRKKLLKLLESFRETLLQLKNASKKRIF